MYPSSSEAASNLAKLHVSGTRQMGSRASWEKLLYTINDGRNANTVRVLLTSRYPLLLSDLNAEQDAALRATTLTVTDAVVQLFTCACTQGNLSWVEHLLPICGANCVDVVHETPLAAAAHGGHMEVLEYLHHHGAVIKFPALFTAADQGNTEALEFLLSRIDHLADLDIILQRVLCQAVFTDNPTIVSLLTAHGADATTPLIRNISVLSESQSPEMTMVLLREGAEMRSNSEDE